ELVEIRGEPRELALEDETRRFGQLRRTELERLVRGQEARAHELFAHLPLIGAADRAVLAPRDRRMHAQARAEARAQLDEAEVVELHEPAAQQLLVSVQLAGDFARRVPVGQQVERAEQLRIGGEARL